MGLFDQLSAKARSDTQKLKELRAWFDDSPLADTHQACGLLSEQLRMIREQIHAPENRVEAANILQPVIEASLDRTWDQYGKEQVMVQESALEMIQLAGDLYADCAREATETRNKKGAPLAWVHVAHYRAMVLLGSVIIHAYLRYIPPPANAWLCIHGLYRRCEMFEFADQPIPSEFQSEQDLAEPSPANAFMRLALFAAANPFQMNRQEGSFLYQLLTLRVAQCRLRAVHMETDLFERFYIDLAQDSRPRTIYDGLPGKLENLRYIDIEPLLISLELDAKAHKDSDKEGIILRQNIRARIKRSLNNRQERRHDRSTDFGKISIVVGVAGIHGVLSDGATFEPASQARALFEQCSGNEDMNNLDFAAMPPDEAEQIIRMGAWADEEIVLSSNTPNGVGRSQSSNSPIHIEHPTLIDRGDRGLRLFVDENAQKIPQVGELIGYRMDGPDEPWRIGLVRWVRRENGGIHFGITRFSDTALPAAARSLEDGSPAFQRTLIVPAKPIESASISLIVPVGSMDPGNLCLILAQNRLYTVRLKDLRAATQTVSQYELDIIETCPPL